MSNEKTYSLNKSRQILKSSNKWYKRRKHQLSPIQLQEFETQLQTLDTAVLNKQNVEASKIAHELEAFCELHFKKTLWEHLSELGIAIIVALLVATIVRQTWFELYEIPTGSMRPTFKEQDHLTVTKTAFGINVPLQTKHFYFEPENVQRTSVVIWSGDGIPHLDSDSTFMGIFPYTKRYIKRCMGKPGDTLYFYGGKIYGFDREGRDLVELRDNQWTTKLEYLPFVRFEGRESFKQLSKTKENFQLFFHHFNQAIGRFNFNKQNLKGEVFNGKEWIKDNPLAQNQNHDTIQTFSDWWGIRNFAIARLLTPEQLETLTSYKTNEMEKGLLYLELRHTPSLSYPAPLFSQRGSVAVQGYSTIIPLQERHLKALMDNMYTCRFIVDQERGASYSVNQSTSLFSLKFIQEMVNSIAGKKVFNTQGKIHPYQPLFPGVENGSYEFYYGKGVRVGWGAITHELTNQNPLLNSTSENIQKLFNVGIEMSTLVEPQSRNQIYFPNRYLYFRDGDLYAMGGVLMKREDPVLVSFNEQELKKQKASTSQSPYIAFRDYGPPLSEDGTLDKKFIETFGLKIPEGYYLMLGDNHAMSQDSRYFGPIPQANLQGAPSLIIWPTGERWGIPNQKPYPLFPLSRLVIWSIAGLIAIIWWIIHQRNKKKPIFKKL